MTKDGEENEQQGTEEELLNIMLKVDKDEET